MGEDQGKAARGAVSLWEGWIAEGLLNARLMKLVSIETNDSEGAHGARREDGN